MKKSIGIILILSVLFVTCENHILDNPVDPEAENYVGVESVDIDGDGIGSFEDVDEIVIAGPADGAVLFDIVNLKLTIQLLNPEKIITYRIQLSTDISFTSNIILDDSTLSSNEFTIPAATLANNTTYYWRAMAFDGIKWSDDWSSTSSFTVDMEEAVSPTPSNSSTINSIPLLNWVDVETAYRYEIQVSSNNDFSSLLESDNTISQSQYQVTSVLANSSWYYWRLRIQNADGVWGDWSTVWDFYMNIIFTKHIIVYISYGVSSVYATDVDSDGDIDVLGASYDETEMTWWENDGNENFVKKIISDNFVVYNGSARIYATDVDNDGDTDVIGTTDGSNEMGEYGEYGDGGRNKKKSGL